MGSTAVQASRRISMIGFCVLNESIVANLLVSSRMYCVALLRSRLCLANGVALRDGNALCAVSIAASASFTPAKATYVTTSPLPGLNVFAEVAIFSFVPLPTIEQSPVLGTWRCSSGRWSVDEIVVLEILGLAFFPLCNLSLPVSERRIRVQRNLESQIFYYKTEVYIALGNNDFDVLLYQLLNSNANDNNDVQR